MGVEIIKNAIPHSLCLAAEAAWPDQFWPHWHRYNGATANKFGSMDRARIPAACLAALDALALAVIPHIGDSSSDQAVETNAFDCSWLQQRLAARDGRRIGHRRSSYYSADVWTGGDFRHAGDVA